MSSIKKGFNYAFKKFIDWVFRKKSLTACLYILIVFAVRELVTIFYGNDIYNLLIELQKNTSEEWIVTIISFIKIFFQNGYWTIFLIEIGLIFLVAFLIYSNSNKPLKFNEIDSDISEYTIGVKFIYILYNFFCFQRDLFVPGIYETTFEKQRVLQLYQRLKSKCHMLFEKHKDELPITTEEFQTLMTITEELRQENEIMLSINLNNEKISKDMWNTYSKLGSRGLMMAVEFEKRVNHNEYESLINHELKNQLLGFKDQHSYEEYIRPTAKSILNKPDSRELHLVKYVVKKKGINIESCLSNGFEESELAELYNKLSRSKLAFFEDEKIIITPKGLDYLKRKLRNYKYIKIKNFIEKVLILDDIN